MTLRGRTLLRMRFDEAVSKFADHVPLYRLCQIYGRDGVEMSRSTITDMMGNCALMLTPLADALGRYVLKAGKVHGDDTPIRALGGKGKTARTARLWVYVRDDRASADKAPPALPAGVGALSPGLPVAAQPVARATASTRVNRWMRMICMGLFGCPLLEADGRRPHNRILPKPAAGRAGAGLQPQ